MSSKLTRALKNPRRYLKARTAIDFARVNNAVLGLRSCPSIVPSGLRELDEVRTRSLSRTDINDHLETIFVEALSARPRLIVELGVRSGESTFVLERVAKLCQSRLISVDIDDCSDIHTYRDATFVQSDDIEFAKTFGEWCKASNIDPEIDVLYIDTSHVFEHTLEEIRSWFPYLADRAKVMFHDTNLKAVFRRRDGTMGITLDTERGVIRALETHFNTTFDETKDFIDVRDGWLIRHHTICSGFMTLERLGI